MSTTNTLNITNDGLQDFDSSTGNFTTIDLTTKGDLLGFDSSNYQRFPVGTDGYVLKADSTQTVGLRWACPGIEFISSQIANNSSSIDFTSFADPDCYSGYKLIWKDVKDTGKNVGLRLRFSIDNGSSWLSSNYKYCKESIRDNDTGNFYGSGSISYITINNWFGSTTISGSFNGEAFFYSSTDPTNKLSQGLVFSSILKGHNLLTSRGYALNTTTSQVNGFQFLMDSGTIPYGEFWLYGVLEG